MKNDWYANTVRFQVSQGALQYEYEHGLSAYTDMAAAVINEARAQQLVVIVSMQTEARSCSPKNLLKFAALRRFFLCFAFLLS